jgi:pimeloyl-ACP methyl ester carboxylesterase
LKVERFRTRAGSVLHVEDTGSGPPLLGLHGLGGGAWFFGGFARRMAPHCRVLAVDLPGTGRSTSAAVPTVDAWLADLRDLLEARAGGPAVLLGHSMGTILALRLAAEAPALVRALIVVGGLPAPLDEVKARLEARAAMVAREGLAGVGAQAALANFAQATLETRPELVGLYERLFELQDSAVYVHWCRMLIGASAEAAVPAVRVPCLSISGDEDKYAPPDEVAKFVARLPAGTRSEILPACGHLPFLEAPEAFAGSVQSFLAAVC